MCFNRLMPSNIFFCYYFVIVCLWVNVVGQDTCVAVSPNLTVVDDSYGSMNTFYDIAQGISRGMQADLTDEYLKQLAYLYQNTLTNFFNGETGDFSRRQIGLIIFLVFGGVFVIILPLSGIVFCISRLCGRCGAKRVQRHRSRCALSIYLLVLLTACGLICSGIVLYAVSVHKGSNAIDHIEDYTTPIAEDCKIVVNAATSNLDCTANQAVGGLFTNIRANISTFGTTIIAPYHLRVDNIAKQVTNLQASSSLRASASTSIQSSLAALTALNPFVVGKPDASTEIQDRTAVLNTFDATLTNIQTTLTALNAQLTNAQTSFGGNVGKSETSLNTALQAAGQQVLLTDRTMTGFFSQLASNAAELENAIEEADAKIRQLQTNVNEYSKKRTVTNSIYAIVLVPCIAIVTPALIALVFGVFRVCSRDADPSARSTLSHLGGYIALISVTAAFLLGWIVMAIASIGFFGGHTIETICKPLFRDDEMRVFKFIPQFDINFTNPLDGRLRSVNLGDILSSCRDGGSIFDALNGETLLNADTIVDQLDLDNAALNAKAAFLSADLSYAFPNDNLNELTQAHAGFDTTNLNPNLPFCNETNPDETAKAVAALTDTKNQLDAFKTSLQTLISGVLGIVQDGQSSAAQQNASATKIVSLFDSTKQPVSNEIDIAKAKLSENSYRCRPVYDTWQNIGAVLCGRVGRPIQGVWAAAGLAAIFFVPLIVALILESKYLFRMRPHRHRAQDTFAHMGQNGMQRGAGGIMAYGPPYGATGAYPANGAANRLGRRESTGSHDDLGPPYAGYFAFAPPLGYERPLAQGPQRPTSRVPDGRMPTPAAIGHNVYPTPYPMNYAQQQQLPLRLPASKLQQKQQRQQERQKHAPTGRHQGRHPQGGPKAIEYDQWR